MNWNYRGFSFFVLLAVSLLSAFGLPHLKTDTTPFSLISRSDPDRETWEQSLRQFGSDQLTRVYVRDDSLWSEAKLLALSKLHQELRALEFVTGIDDLFTHRLIRGKGGELESGEILATIPKGQGELDRLLALTTNDPLVAGNLLSRTGTWTAITLSLKEAGAGAGVARQRHTALNALVNAHVHEFQEVFAIGPQRLEAECHATLVNDCLRLAPAFALVVSLVVLLLSRCWSSALVPLLTAALTLLWTLGLMGWTGIPLTIAGALLPPLAIAVAFISTVQAVFLCRQKGARDRSSLGVRCQLRVLGLPLLMTVTVMAVGIAPFATTGIEAIKGFAIVATLAVLANGVALMLLFPHLLCWLTATPPGQEEARQPQGPGGLGRVVPLVIRSPGSIVAFALFFTAFSLSLGTRLTVSADPTALFRESTPLRTQITELHGKLTGHQTFRITLVANKEKAFLEPRNIERLTRIQQFLEKQGEFQGSTSLADLLSLANREFHGGSSKHYRPPGKKELVAQYLLLFNRQELAPYATPDLRQATIVVHQQTTDSDRLNAAISELKGVIANLAGEEIQATVSGEGLMANQSAPLLRHAWVNSLLIQAGVVLLLVSLMFVSPFGGLATLILTVIPLAMTVGLMAAAQLPLTIGTAMACILSCGFLLHGTLHLFSRYSDLCRTTPDYGQAVLTAVREEAAPMGTTAIALLAGCPLLTLSGFSFVAQMGLTAAGGLLFAWLTLILVAPLLMSRLRLVGLYEILRMSIDQGALARSSLFQGMSRYQIKKAILISELHEFAPGSLLVAQGSIGRSMYLILEGEAEVIHHGEVGATTQRLAILTAGEVFGEIGYVRENSRTADVRARTRVLALRFDYQRMRNDLHFFPFIVAKINFNICRILGERLAGAVNSLGHQQEGATQGQIAKKQDVIR